MPNFDCKDGSETFPDGQDGRDGQVYSTAETPDGEFETPQEHLEGLFTELSNTVKDIADVFDEIFQVIDSEDKKVADKS